MEALRAQLAMKLEEKARLQAQTIIVQAHTQALTQAINAAVKEETAGGSRKRRRAASSSSSDSSDSDAEPKALEDAVETETVAEVAVVPGPVVALVPVPVAALPALVPLPAVAALPAPVPLPAFCLVPGTGRGRPSTRPLGPHCPRCSNLKNKKAGGKHSRDVFCENLTRWPL